MWVAKYQIAMMAQEKVRSFVAIVIIGGIQIQDCGGTLVCQMAKRYFAAQCVL
jgi:alanyl-tRNA synthetase